MNFFRFFFQNKNIVKGDTEFQPPKILQLSTDILCLVSEFLSDQDVKSFLLVCKDWYTVHEHYCVWKRKTCVIYTNMCVKDLIEKWKNKNVYYGKLKWCSNFPLPEEMTDLIGLWKIIFLPGFNQVLSHLPKTVTHLEFKSLFDLQFFRNLPKTILVIHKPEYIEVDDGDRIVYYMGAAYHLSMY